MKRTNLYLKTGQIKQLRAIAKRTGAPVAGLIRRAIDEMIERLDAEEKRKSNGGTHDNTHS